MCANVKRRIYETVDTSQNWLEIGNVLCECIPRRLIEWGPALTTGMAYWSRFPLPDKYLYGPQIFVPRLDVSAVCVWDRRFCLLNLGLVWMVLLVDSAFQFWVNSIFLWFYNIFVRSFVLPPCTIMYLFIYVFQVTNTWHIEAIQTCVPCGNPNHGLLVHHLTIALIRKSNSSSKLDGLKHIIYLLYLALPAFYGPTIGTQNSSF